MKKAIFVLIFMVCAGFSVQAEDRNDLNFTPVGGGSYIYCNNSEGILNTDLADNTYGAPSYIMNNDGLMPGKYEIYLTHFNMTTTDLPDGTKGPGPDIVLDVVFTAAEDSTIIINRSSCEVPESRVYYKGGIRGAVESEWSALFGAADILGEDICELHTGRVYKSREIEPVTVHLKKGDEFFLSSFTDNYRSVPFPKHVFLASLFEISSGKINAGVIALKAKDDIFDRSSFVRGAAFGAYKRDRTQKGIADSLPESECTLSFTVDDETEDGAYLPVTVHNQYTDANLCYEWCTHLNPQDDIYSKTKTAESDMLTYRYKDPSKLSFYGSAVPDEEKDDVWVFNPFRSDTKEYVGERSGYTAENYIPNYPLSPERDNSGFACSMGNYGVFATYNITVNNEGARDRYFNYLVTTTANVVVRAADSKNKTIGSVTSKNSSFTQSTDTMACIKLPKNKKTTFSVSVMLPPQNFGGIRQSFMISDKYQPLDYSKDSNVYPVLSDSVYPAAALMKKSDMQTKRRFEGTEKNLDVVKTDFGYAAVYNTVSGQPNYYASNWSGFCKVFLFNKRFELIKQYSLSSPPVEIGYANKKIYVKTARNGILQMSDTLPPLSTAFVNIPRQTMRGCSVVQSENGFSLSFDGENYYKIKFQSKAPEFVEQSDGYVYYCDGNKAGISADGIYFSSVESSEDITSVKTEKGILTCSDGSKLVPFSKETPIVRLGDSYLAFDSPPVIINDRTMVPMRFIFECYGMDVTWDSIGRRAAARKGDTSLIFTVGQKTVSVNGEETESDTESMIIADRTYIPLRFLSETLGYSVDWDADNRVISIN
ncbi:MAG: hypothetical protein J6N52_14010 [Clostridia bacterium]|nr:hypothetical protein [Clostridia bacterium]